MFLSFLFFRLRVSLVLSFSFVHIVYSRMQTVGLFGNQPNRESYLIVFSNTIYVSKHPPIPLSSRKCLRYPIEKNVCLKGNDGRYLAWERVYVQNATTDSQIKEQGLWWKDMCYIKKIKYVNIQR